jgi:penicillin-binding protein 1A
MAQAYSVFMNYGDRVKPFGIKRILGPDGQVIREWEPDIARGALDSSVCAAMDEFLRAVVTGGTATMARSIEDARGKTGTTSENKDAWFCGYTNNLVGIGWVASERKVGNRTVYDPMPSVFGGKVTVQIWTGVMKAAVKKYGSARSHRPENLRPLASTRSEPEPVEPPVDDVTGGNTPEPPAIEPPFPTDLPPLGEGPPEDRSPTEVNPGQAKPSEKPPRSEESPTVSVEVCAETGQLANRYCPETVTRKFPKSEAPKGRCTLHGS